MKATEFVKKHGLVTAKWILSDQKFAPPRSVHLEPHEVEFTKNDLKRLVESHELVEKWQGLNAAKIKVVLLRVFGLTTQADQLEHAATDVESCQ